jgi:predicted TIM-barrel fold metal-dependent hydrolase
MNRRTFLGAAAAATAVSYAAQPATKVAIPIIDTHIHLFDQTRPQGVPYSGGGRNTEPSLPPRYRKLAEPLGIVGAIEIEASPWIEDNLWVLEVQEKDPMMLGTIGNLQPEKPEFKEYLERYHRNKLFLGIRYGNLWGYNLIEQIANPTFVEGLKLMQQAGLALDSANPRPDLLNAIVQVSDKVPGLRIIIDHLPGMFYRLDAGSKAGVEATIKELVKRPQVYVKVSAVMRVVDGKASLDPALYKPTLDYLFESFGEDRLIFGSDWPNGEAVDNLPNIVKIVQDYFLAKGQAAAEKYFWKNSKAAYRWTKRDPMQPS